MGNILRSKTYVKKNCTFSISEEISEKLDEFAIKTKHTKSAVVELALEDYIKRMSGSKLKGKSDNR